MSDIFVCKESSIVDVDGVPTLVTKDVTRVRAGHWLLDQYPELFKPITVHYDVEQTTEHPGEVRGDPPPPATPPPPQEEEKKAGDIEPVPPPPPPPAKKTAKKSTG